MKINNIDGLSFVLFKDEYLPLFFENNERVRAGDILTNIIEDDEWEMQWQVRESENEQWAFQQYTPEGAADIKSKGFTSRWIVRLTGTPVHPQGGNYIQGFVGAVALVLKLQGRTELTDDLIKRVGQSYNEFHRYNLLAKDVETLKEFYSEIPAQ